MLQKAIEDGPGDSLSRPGSTLARLVLFSLRIGDVVDVNKWLPEARLRPNVVLHHLCDLVERQIYRTASAHEAHAVTARFRKLVAERLPHTEDHFPDA